MIIKRYKPEVSHGPFGASGDVAFMKESESGDYVAFVDIESLLPPKQKEVGQKLQVAEGDRRT